MFRLQRFPLNRRHFCKAALEEHHASLAERVGYLEKAPCDKPGKWFCKGFQALAQGAGRRVGKRCLLLGVETPLLAGACECVCIYIYMYTYICHKLGNYYVTQGPSIIPPKDANLASSAIPGAGRLCRPTQRGVGHHQKPLVSNKFEL